MAELFSKIPYYFGFPFVRYALLAGVLISLCSSLLGVSLVLKRFSFIDDGLSHVAFGAMAIAALFSLSSEMIVVLPVTVLSAVLLLRVGGRARVRGDAALAMISTGAMAIGYLVLNVFSASANVSGDVCSTLFGSTSILTLTALDVWICVVMSLVVMLAFAFFYNRIFAVTFDESFAAATGTRANACNLIIAVITAVIIVLAMNLVGSLLTSALVVFPALSAMRVFKSFRGVVCASAILSVVCSALGILASILISTPVGSTIVVVQIAVFLAFWAWGMPKGGARI
ncbi:MAG: metal ABC transporter permease [Clostridiales bacterium]|nr:metal ABC transporter permease [Clostridiales bacterium]